MISEFLIPHCNNPSGFIIFFFLMIRLSLLFVLLAFLIGLLLYWRFPAFSVLRHRQFVGIQSCRGCHGTAASGDQYEQWKSSAHARAYDELRGDSARTYAATRKSSSPETDSACLRCHSTAFANIPSDRGSTFQVEDGVTCEACHGPSSDYSTYSIMRDKKLFLQLGGRRGSEHECNDCHALSLNDPHCPFQRTAFVAAAAMKIIAHSAPRKTATP